MNKEEFYTDFANKIISMIENRTTPWTWDKGWEVGNSCNMTPANAISKKHYRGINRIYLAVTAMKNGWNDPRWMTFVQAKKAGYKIKKGSKSAPIVFFEMKPKKGAEPVDYTITGNPVYDKKDLIPVMKLFNVFNAQQIENMPTLPTNEISYTWQPCEKAEKILKNSKAKIIHDSFEAYYRPSTDEIHVPEKKYFKGTEYYYETVLHELSHWTGAANRLNRTGGKKFGDHAYAAEELVAEISSWMLTEEIGIRTEAGAERSAAYVDDWRHAVANAYKDGKLNPEIIIKACREAEKAFEYIMKFAEPEAAQAN